MSSLLVGQFITIVLYIDFDRKSGTFWTIHIYDLSDVLHLEGGAGINQESDSIQKGTDFYLSNFNILLCNQLNSAKMEALFTFIRRVPYVYWPLFETRVNMLFNKSTMGNAWIWRA